MKKFIFVFIGILSLANLSTPVRADIVVQWNFNFPLSTNIADTDDSVLTGTNAPCVGAGIFAFIGGTVPGLPGGYDTGSPNCPPCDPFYQFTLNNPKTGLNTNNSAISVTNFPAQGTANLSAGVEVAFSTVGYTNISVSWEQRHQQRTGRYHRLQYSVDGVTFIDVPAVSGGVISLTTQNIFFPQTNHLSSVSTAINNNPNVKLRIVAEFESTAINTGNANYVGTVAGDAANYRTTSEVRLDMFTVWGDPTGSANAFPTISVDQTNLNTVANAPVTNTFTIGDAETPVNSLNVTGASGNTALIPSGNIVFLDTTGATRRVVVTAAPTCENSSGSADIALTVTDGAGQFVSAIFEVAVASGSPEVQNPIDTKSLQNTDGFSTVTLADLNTPASGLSINHKGSSIPGVITSSGIAVSGTDSNRTVTLTPQLDALGATIISIGATDGTCADTNSFFYTVVPLPDVILYESFNHYADGPLTTSVGGGVWRNNADTPGAIQIQSQALRLNTAGAEEFIRCPLADRNSYLETNSPGLYSAMKVVLLQLPTGATPANNSHIGAFNGPGSPGSQRARVFASLEGADPGFYRLGVSSGTNRPTAYLGTNLSLNVPYKVVSYYNPTNGTARLWVDPVSPSDTYAEATDYEIGNIEHYSLRQRPVSSDALIDDLVVATSFEGALLLPPAPTLNVALSGADVIISWATNGASGFNLYSKASLSTGTWEPAGTPVINGSDYVVTILNATGSRFYRLEK